MSFPRYPRYKDSGVKWLGDVPEHWAVKRLGYYFTERREKVSDTEFPPLSVTKNGIVPQIETAAKTDDGDNRKKVCSGDFVINSRSDRKGSSGVSPLDGSVSLINTVIRTQERVHTPFIDHLLRSHPFQEEFYRFGRGIVADLWSTTYSEMRNIILSVPDLDEQRLIASFLDRETAKINGLISEHRRLVELLREKRQGVISHAVTKGLKRHTVMKPSGVEGLGGVPEHWQVSRLSMLCDVLAGFPFDATLFGVAGVPVIRMSDFGAGIVRTEDAKRVEPADIPSTALAQAGDVLLGLSGSISNFAFVRAQDLPIAINQRVAIIRMRETEKQLVFWFLQSREFLSQLTADLPETTIQNVSMGRLRRCRIPIPPIGERQMISEFLDSEITKLDTLAAEAEHTIDLLQERRMSLISAAVTGKIDIRGLADAKVP